MDMSHIHFQMNFWKWTVFKHKHVVKAWLMTRLFDYVSVPFFLQILQMTWIRCKLNLKTNHSLAKASDQVEQDLLLSQTTFRSFPLQNLRISLLLGNTRKGEGVGGGGVQSPNFKYWEQN